MGYNEWIKKGTIWHILCLVVVTYFMALQHDPLLLTAVMRANKMTKWND